MRTEIYPSTLGALVLVVVAGCSQDNRTTPEAEAKPGPVASAAIASSSAPAPAASIAQPDAPQPDAPQPDAPQPSVATDPAPPTSSGGPTAKSPTAPKAAPSAAPTGPVVGETSSVTASAKVDAPYHCNEKYPTKFVTSGGSNVSYPSTKVAGGCSGESVASATIPFVPTAAGAGTVQGKLKYGICDADDCRVVEKDVTLPFNATAK
jgi:hypothetical protein